jgi:hypothetical protein
MTRSWMSLVLVAMLAGCGTQQRQPAIENIADVGALPGNGQAPASLPPAPDTIKPGEPGGLPDDRTPVEEGPIDPKSGQGAGQVLQRFGEGKASGLTEAEFVAAYDKYAEIHSEVGAPGPMEGAAGSAYVEIPFRLYGTLKTGKPFNLFGPVTLRRVNDVPGSSEEQRRWHIYQSGLKPRP